MLAIVEVVMFEHIFAERADFHVVSGRDTDKAATPDQYFAYSAETNLLQFWQSVVRGENGGIGVQNHVWSSGRSIVFTIDEAINAELLTVEHQTYSFLPSSQTRFPL